MPDNTYIEIPNTEERKQNQNVKHLNLIARPLPFDKIKKRLTLLTVTEYLCHKWQRICFTFRNDCPVPYSFMTYHRVCN